MQYSTMSWQTRHLAFLLIQMYNFVAIIFLSNKQRKSSSCQEHDTCLFILNALCFSSKNVHQWKEADTLKFSSSCALAFCLSQTFFLTCLFLQMHYAIGVKKINQAKILSFFSLKCKKANFPLSSKNILYKVTPCRVWRAQPVS